MLDWDSPYECEGQMTFNEVIMHLNDEIGENDEEIETQPVEDTSL